MLFSYTWPRRKQSFQCWSSKGCGSVYFVTALRQGSSGLQKTGKEMSSYSDTRWWSRWTGGPSPECTGVWRCSYILTGTDRALYSHLTPDHNLHSLASTKVQTPRRPLGIKSQLCHNSHVALGTMQATSNTCLI